MGTIAEKLTYLNGTKTAIKNAIINKGVAVSDTDTFRSYASKIESMQTGGGGDIKQNDLNAVMTGNFYDILTDNFIDQIMTGHYIKKGE